MESVDLELGVVASAFSCNEPERGCSDSVSAELEWLGELCKKKWQGRSKRRWRLVGTYMSFDLIGTTKDCQVH